MHFHSSMITALVAFGYNVNASPIEARQGIGASLFNAYLSTTFKGIFGTPAQCGTYFPDYTFWAARGNGNSPLPWELCYEPGSQEFTQDDSNVAQCLTNLHYAQKDTCISVAGSECDNGYLAGGGRIQNSKLSFAGAHTGINSDQSRSIQGGVDALVGSHIRTDYSDNTHYFPVFSALSETNGVTEVSMMLNYVGESEC